MLIIYLEPGICPSSCLSSVLAAILKSRQPRVFPSRESVSAPEAGCQGWEVSTASTVPSHPLSATALQEAWQGACNSGLSSLVQQKERLPLCFSAEGEGQGGIAPRFREGLAGATKPQPLGPEFFCRELVASRGPSGMLCLSLPLAKGHSRLLPYNRPVYFHTYDSLGCLWGWLWGCPLRGPSGAEATSRS